MTKRAGMAKLVRDLSRDPQVKRAIASARRGKRGTEAARTEDAAGIVLLALRAASRFAGKKKARALDEAMDVIQLLVQASIVLKENVFDRPEVKGFFSHGFRKIYSPVEELVAMVLPKPKGASFAGAAVDITDFVYGREVMKAKRKNSKNAVTLLNRIETLLGDVLKEGSVMEKSVEKTVRSLLRSAGDSITAAKEFFIVPGPVKGRPKVAKAAKRAASRRAAGTRSKSSAAGRRPAAKKRGSKTAKPASPVAAPVASESPSVPPAGV